MKRIATLVLGAGALIGATLVAPSAASADSSSWGYIPMPDVTVTQPSYEPDFEVKAAASNVWTVNTGSAGQTCDASQVLGYAQSSGPGELNVTMSRAVQSQASVSVTAGVSASVTAEVGLNATFQGFGATGKLGTTITGSLSGTFGYDVQNTTTITSGYTTSVPVGQTWTATIVPAYQTYNYAVFADIWNSGKTALATGQLRSPVGYCYRIDKATNIVANGNYFLSTAASTGGSPLVLSQTHSANSDWIFQGDGTIRRRDDASKCLDIKDGAVNNGTPVILWSCTGGQNQQWAADAKTGQIVNPATGKCLDVSGGVSYPGAVLIIWPCLNQTNQRFTWS